MIAKELIYNIITNLHLTIFPHSYTDARDYPALVAEYKNKTSPAKNNSSWWSWLPWLSSSEPSEKDLKDIEAKVLAEADKKED